MGSGAATARNVVHARPGPGPAPKLAAQVADRIVGDVIAMGWPAGELLGSEAGLLERYQVGRAVFREAVRLVEHQQVARTRRGPGGGLVITEPTVAAVVDAVVLYLYRVGAGLDELFEARAVLEDVVAELAPERLGEPDVARLMSFLPDGGADGAADPRTLHAVLASVTNNPALELFVAVLHRVTALYSAGRPDLAPAPRADASREHAGIAAAVIARDPGLARVRMRDHLEAERGHLTRRRPARDLLRGQAVADGEPVSGKRAEAVARNITVRIVGGGIRPGQRVGAERELIDQQGVSRAVLREAVRLLEHHQIARMRRGPGGGLIAEQPSAAAATEIAAIYLARHGLRPAELAELRTSVESALCGFAAERAGATAGPGLRAAIDRESAVGGPDDEATADLHTAVARAARSRVLELVALVVMRLSRLHRMEPPAVPAGQDARADLLRSHEEIAAAVASADRPLAVRRMRRHLDALAVLIGSTDHPSPDPPVLARAAADGSAEGPAGPGSPRSARRYSSAT